MSKRYLSAAARVLIALSFCTMAATAAAQDYPTRPVRIVVAFPAGGGNDIIARFFSARLTVTHCCSLR